ncbi:hypothetical protein [Homoserinimonas hongtaonis]|uniref:hypothetical protein n=1 Tax=Homoserinimonas hongtaonis TaxID=2079791 RepID=UPI000D394CC9|nr:hypothetical protein [Salinibacterium hongtaonis]AWB89749.1 hypothetical protein C2138_09560 [Salinibacterium hongtaonis]
METNASRTLTRLAGTWESTGVLVADDGETEAWRGRDIYEFLPGGLHLAHRVDVVISGERRQSLEILTPSPQPDGGILQTSYEQDGSIEHSKGVVDSRGRYAIDAGDARAILAFTGPATMSARWELRCAAGTWREWMRVTFRRIDASR